jgi:hypothetical protein
VYSAHLRLARYPILAFALIALPAECFAAPRESRARVHRSRLSKATARITKFRECECFRIR